MGGHHEPPQQDTKGTNPMMAMLIAHPTAGTYHIVCDTCLWTSPTPLHETAADAAANTHKTTCPGEIPTTRSNAQKRHAKNLLSGNY